MDEKTVNLLKRAAEALRKNKPSDGDSHSIDIQLKEPASVKQLTEELQKTKISLRSLFEQVVDAIRDIDMQPPAVTVNTPDEVSIKKPNWLKEVFSLKNIEDKLELIKNNLSNLPQPKDIQLPVDPKNPMAVRLSDGNRFIEQLTQVVQTGSGGSSIPKITAIEAGSSNVIAVPSVNPDGTNIFGGLHLKPWDYVVMALSNGDATETYTFKIGGASGTLTNTVVVVYTGSTRDVLTSVTKI